MWEFVWFVVFTVLGEWLRPKPKDQPSSSVGEFQFPTAEDGRPIPIVAGRVKVSGYNVVWYGDLGRQNIREKVSWLGSTAIVGHKYLIGFQAAICLGPIDAIEGLRWDGKEVPLTSSAITGGRRLTIDGDQLFGGKRSEGGVSGDMDLLFGGSDHVPNDYLLEAMEISDLPSWHGVCMAISRKMYIGTTRYIKEPEFIIRKFPNELGLQGGRHVVNGRSANPAAFIYHLLTNYEVGIHYPASQIGVEKLRAVGDALFAEGMGINLQIDQPSVGGEMIDEILRHIDAVRYLHPVTGLLEIDLIREIADPDALPVLDASNIVSVEIEEPSWAELVNYITVEYIDQDFKKRAVPYPNLAAIARRGEIEHRTYQYHGFDSEHAALQMAARLAKRHGYPLKAGTIVCDRSMWALREGSAVMWSGYPLDVSPRVMRVVQTSHAEIEDGRITLEVVEDVFSVTDLAYESPVSEWVNPLIGPFPLVAQRLLEAPFHFVPGDTQVLLWALGVRTGQADMAMQAWVDRGNNGTAWVEGNELFDFCPSALLTHDYNPDPGIDAVGFTIGPGIDIQDLANATEDQFQRGLQLALIGDELFAWRYIETNPDGTHTISRVMRGVLDTAPRPHSQGARVFFLTEARTLAEDLPVTPDQAVGVRLLPSNGERLLPFGSASTVSITTNSRAARPYPPGNVQVDGDWNPGTVVGDLPITWSHRSRVDQYNADQMVAQDVGGSWSPEGDTQLQFWIAGQNRRTENVAGTSFTYTVAMREADYAADLDAPVSIRVYGRNAGGSLSYFHQLVVVDMELPS